MIAKTLLIAAFVVGMTGMAAGKKAESKTTTAAAHKNHAGHDEHKHGKDCGHKSETHGSHTDYEHDGHHHTEHEGHYDECDGPAHS